MTVMSRVELAKIGAKVRLEQLNKERDALLDFIGYPDDLKSKVANGHVNGSGKKKKLHWTQTPEGKRRMSLAQKKRFRESK